MIDAVCFGEALVDLLPDKRGRLREVSKFEACSGGAPANVAVGLARLGLKTAFVGVLGDDEFGYFLESQLRRENIDARLRFTKKALTGLWFVALDRKGDRTFFAPTGADSADKLLELQDVKRIPDSRIFHCGSSAHVLPGSGEVLLAAMREARKKESVVSFDPNVRAHLWQDLSDLRQLCQRAFPLCDIVKLSEDELAPTLGLDDPERALDALHELGVRLACVTLGERGALARRGNERVQLPAPRVEVVDTTGAGDGFVAGLLSSDPLDADLHAVIRRACEVGSAVCTKLGAIGGLPRQ